MNNGKNPVVIKKGLRLGDLEAETDNELLKDVFIDCGELELLQDVERPESLILARTGAGKSALLLELERRVNKSKFLDPNDISINFLESSDIIQFFDELNVNLDIFYKLLWKHLITVELLKLRYEILDEQKSSKIWRWMQSTFGVDQGKKEALSYFEEYENTFWMTTDKQLKEVTTKLAKDIKTRLGAKYEGIELSLEGAKSVEEEQKSEVVSRATEVVNSLQIQKLSRLINLLNDQVFDDAQKPFYILIDKLDENWAKTRIRYRFIRALIEEIKTFRSIENIKIIVSLRQDLFETVLDKTRDVTFQQEKFESYFVYLKWNKANLKKMIDKRINTIFKRQYTADGVCFDDIFPTYKNNNKNQVQAIDYLLNRTLFRPRDILQYINECFIASEGKTKITQQVIKDTEAIYSEKRFNSLIEEWNDFYPAIRDVMEFLRGVSEEFSKQYFYDNIEEVSLGMYDLNLADPCVLAARDYIDNGVSSSGLVSVLIDCFYRIGAIGVKMGENSSYRWSNVNQGTLLTAEVKRVKSIKIHKMLHRALGVKTQ